MATPAIRRHLHRACTALQEAVAAAAAQVPAEVMRRPPVDVKVRTARAEVAEALARYPAPCIQGFAEALEALVAESRVPLQARRMTLDALGIMDDQQVQEEVEVVQAGRVLAEDAGPALLRLSRLEALLDGQPTRESESPLGPAVIGRALWRGTERLPLSIAARTEAVRCLTRLLAPKLGPLYARLVDEAEKEEGLAVPVEAPRPPPPPVQSEAPPVRGDAPPRRRRPTPPTQGASSAVPLTAAGGGPRFDVTRPGALAELASVRGSVGEATGGPASVRAGAQAPARAGAETADIRWLIHRIFDEIASEPSLGADEAGRIDRLRPAFLQLADHDADLLQTHRHPAWRLVNEVCALLAGDAAHRPPNLDSWLERFTAKLEGDPSRERFESAERKLASWRDKEARRQAATMAQAVDLLRRHAQLEEGAEAARARLERQLDASRADQVVRRFVSTVWALACARQAAGPAPARGEADAWDTAADLIWSTSPARSRADSPTLMAMIPALVASLRAGMDRLAITPEVQAAWLSRLGALHERAMARTPEDAQTDMPLTIDLALEDEIPTAAPPALAAAEAPTVRLDLPAEASPASEPEPTVRQPQHDLAPPPEPTVRQELAEPAAAAPEPTSRQELPDLPPPPQQEPTVRQELPELPPPLSEPTATQPLPELPPPPPERAARPNLRLLTPPPPQPAARPNLRIVTPPSPEAAVRLDLPGLAPPPADPVDALRIGDRFRMAVRGTWDEVSLVWRSDKGQFLLLARPDGSTLSVSRRSLHRLMSEGLARLPEPGGALARATQRIAEGRG